MKLAGLRKLSIQRQARIRFRLRNGLDCLITEHGIATVPGLHAIPDFNLEEELAGAREFVLEPVSAAEKKLALTRQDLTALLAPAGASPHADRDDD
jgi:hypothetical protein